jgi:hypothetical protein
MNIAVNTRLLIKNKLEGIGWFTYESLKRITTQHPEHHFYFIFDRPTTLILSFLPTSLPFVLHPSGQASPALLVLVRMEVAATAE